MLRKGASSPIIRFADFSEPWQRVKLNTLVERITRKNKGCVSTLPLTISAQYGLINQTDFFDKQIASSSLEGYYLLYNGDFAYNKSYSNDYPLGAVKRLDLYDNGVVSSLYICFKPLKGVSSDYLAHYFESDKWHEEITIISGEGARNHGLLNMSVKDFFETHHYVPSFAEQERIAQFFNLIERKIKNQEEILSKCERLKSGIINDLFFYSTRSNSWKEVRLSEILKERKTYDVKDSKYPHVTLSKDGIFPKTERYDRDFLVTTEDKEYKITHLHDICYNPANLKFGVICLNTFGDAIFSPIYVTFEIEKGYDPYFIEAFLTSNNFISYIRKYEQGTVYERMAVNPSDFLKGTIKIPELAEQKRIAEILVQLNKRIACARDTLDALKKQRKYFLQNMFL